MSMQLFVILASANAPDVAAWNKALTDAHVPARLESADLRKHTGFLPVEIGGKPAGFFFLLESYGELAGHYPAIAKVRVDKPMVYSLGYGGRFDECAAVFYTASVLVSKFGGTAFDPQGGLLVDSKQLLEMAEQCQKQMDQ